jgi:hypothetical protein
LYSEPAPNPNIFVASLFSSTKRVHSIRSILAHGDTWDDQLTRAGSGISSLPIALGAYGTGANPRILRNQVFQRVRKNHLEDVERLLHFVRHFMGPAIGRISAAPGGAATTLDCFPEGRLHQPP